MQSFPNPQPVTGQDFSIWLNSQNWGSSTRWIAYIAIRLYLKWRYGVSHPALSLKIRRLPSPPQRSLTLIQVKSLLSSFNSSSAKGSRDLSMCSLFLDSGLRCSEMCSLDIRYLSLNDHSLKVFIKGGSWQSAIYSPYTASLISTWLAHRSKIALLEVKNVFISIGGNTSGCKLTRSGLQRIVKYWGNSLGIQLSPHDFRRTFATLATQAGAPSRTLQVAGRWSDLSMVERYTKSINLTDFEHYFPMDFVMRDNS
jgi:integrase/recombinase XerD